MELVRFEPTKPSECKSDALPTELQPLIKRLPRFELGLYLRQRYLLPLQHNRIKTIQSKLSINKYHLVIF